MRFCETHIRINRQELGCGRKHETTKLRQFAEESKIASNCLRLSVRLCGESGVLSRKKHQLSCPCVSFEYLVRPPGEKAWRQLDRLLSRGDNNFQICMAIGTWAGVFFYNLTRLNVTFLICTSIACDQEGATGEKVCERFTLDDTFQQSSIC